MSDKKEDNLAMTILNVSCWITVIGWIVLLIYYYYLLRKERKEEEAKLKERERAEGLDPRLEEKRRRLDEEMRRLEEKKQRLAKEKERLEAEDRDDALIRAWKIRRLKERAYEGMM